LKVFNSVASLSNSLNFYFFEFPFLDGVTNDPTRHVWFDTFVKYAQREVSGSSVSKYTIAGVPFFKKKFDFNLKKGKQLADTDLYFTRVAVSRKNYLPIWVHTPYLYTRSKIWYNDAKMRLLYPSSNKDLLKLKLNLYQTNWYWLSPTFSKTTSAYFTPSFSHSYKSTHRPYTSIQGYQYSLKTLTDILSKREYLYRQTLERRSKIIELPALLRSTPKHPLINEIKSSFLLIDPITYNSEYSREFYYNSLSYFKFLIYKDFLLNLNSSIDQLPINFKLVNNYLFFHFLPQTSTNSLGNREEILKSQFKPLKKGISNMMRLQGSSAVAMPIEIRLQILASSKDVIHSWAIPSAGIKIDCIPGYSSHRIMIFFTPGIYWGQCMEICGRYHHWMPIIIYFMKRDMFFLWCTHFLSKKDPYASQYWEANDRQFADYINFVSYNKSSWLTEVAKDL
jgi:heme/copper-type cytochrome/quinol oxidase subunit 2